MVIISLRFIAAVEIDSSGIVHLSETIGGVRDTVGPWEEYYEEILSRVGPDTFFYDERAFEEVVARASRLLEAERRMRH